MISFYRDFLDGTVYTVVALVAVVLILAIIGFMMEKIKSYKEEQAKIAYVHTKETEQRGDTIVFDSKADHIVGTPVEKTQDDKQESSSSTIMLTPASTPEPSREEDVIHQRQPPDEPAGFLPAQLHLHMVPPLGSDAALHTIYAADRIS